MPAGARPRIALVGLVMAITPHAESYLELADRVEVAWAWSPSQARCGRTVPDACAASWTLRQAPTFRPTSSSERAANS